MENTNEIVPKVIKVHLVEIHLYTATRHGRNEIDEDYAVGTATVEGNPIQFPFKCHRKYVGDGKYEFAVTLEGLETKSLSVLGWSFDYSEISDKHSELYTAYQIEKDKVEEQLSAKLYDEQPAHKTISVLSKYFPAECFSFYHTRDEYIANKNTHMLDIQFAYKYIDSLKNEHTITFLIEFKRIHQGTGYHRHATNQFKWMLESHSEKYGLFSNDENLGKKIAALVKEKQESIEYNIKEEKKKQKEIISASNRYGFPVTRVKEYVSRERRHGGGYFSERTVIILDHNEKKKEHWTEYNGVSVDFSKLSDEGGLIRVNKLNGIFTQIQFTEFLNFLKEKNLGFVGLPTEYFKEEKE